MSDILRCPFCGGILEQSSIFNLNSYACTDLTCKGYYMTATKDMWQELIRTRKALDVLLLTTNRLENQNYKDCVWHLRLAIAKIKAIGITNKALEQITALEQKDVK